MLGSFLVDNITGLGADIIISRSGSSPYATGSMLKFIDFRVFS